MPMNPKTLEAIYEQGVLRPLEQLDLPEHKHVKVTISEVTRTTADAVTNCHDLAEKAGMIGSLKDAPRDLSTNPAHFQGFGSL
jgi:predicted DNA-binding antitoxin AbrB/MazE fold protein